MSQRGVTRKRKASRSPKVEGVVAQQKKLRPDVLQLLSDFANSDAKHDFEGLYDDNKDELNDSLPAPGHNIGENVFETITGTNFRTFLKEIETGKKYFKTNHIGIDYVATATRSINPSGLAELLKGTNSYAIVYDSSNLNFDKLFCAGPPQDITFYFIENREYVGDSASKPKTDTHDDEKSGTGFIINKIKELDNNTTIYPTFDDSVISHFYSNFSIALSPIVNKKVNMNIIKDEDNIITINDTHSELNVNRSIEKIKKSVNEDNIFGIQAGFTGKRSGDWLQALSCTKEHISMRKYEKGEDGSDVNNMPWILVTLDRWLLSYALYLGINVLFTIAKDKKSEGMAIYFESSKSISAIGEKAQMQEFIKINPRFENGKILVEEYDKIIEDYELKINELMYLLIYKNLNLEQTIKSILKMFIQLSVYIDTFSNLFETIRNHVSYFEGKDIASFFKDDTFDMDNAKKARRYYLEMAIFAKNIVGFKEGINLRENIHKYLRNTIERDYGITGLFDSLYSIYSKDDVDSRLESYLSRIYKNKSHYNEQYNIFMKKLNDIRERSLLKEFNKYEKFGNNIFEKYNKEAEKEKKRKEKLRIKIQLKRKITIAAKKKPMTIVKTGKFTKTGKKKTAAKVKGGSQTKKMRTMTPELSVLQNKIEEMRQSIEEIQIYTSVDKTTDPDVENEPIEYESLAPIEVEFNITEALNELEKQENDSEYYNMKNVIKDGGMVIWGGYYSFVYEAIQGYFSKKNLTDMLFNNDFKRFLTLILGRWKKETREPDDEDWNYYDELQDAINYDIMRIFHPKASDGLRVNGISLLEESCIDYNPAMFVKSATLRSTRRRRRTKSAPGHL